MQIFALRLQPDLDLKQSLRDFVITHHIQAGFIVTAVGSLKRVVMRFAGQTSSQVLTDKFEIVSLVGTLSTHGMHLHLAIADQNGNTLGGHLQDGCLIYTTGEIVIGASKELTFVRRMDEQTGFQELEIIAPSDQGE